ESYAPPARCGFCCEAPFRDRERECASNPEGTCDAAKNEELSTAPPARCGVCCETPLQGSRGSMVINPCHHGSIPSESLTFAPRNGKPHSIYDSHYAALTISGRFRFYLENKNNSISQSRGAGQAIVCLEF